MSIIKILQDSGIHPDTEGKNVTPGWANVTCPFCPDTSNHGGFDLSQNKYNCWRCGPHPLIETLHVLTGIPEAQIKKQLLKGRFNFIQKKKIAQHHATKIKIILPYGTHIVNKTHIDYLYSRNFNEFHINKYKLMGTTYLGDYKFRLIIPIIYNDKIVSYQGRDITGLSDLRYKTCAQKDEVIFHKDILYNLDNCKEDYAIIVEGVTDVWRMGDNTCATFGISYTNKQLLLIKERFKKVFILFDNDANERAVELSQKLNNLGVDVGIISIEKDPAELTEKQVSDIKKELTI